MFTIYFIGSAVAIWAAFGAPVAAMTRLYLMFGVGVTVFGVFGAFSFYLPELVPMRLRGTGAGFCYNAGRVITAGFPFAVGMIVMKGVNPVWVLQWVALAPVAGLVLLALGLAVETRGHEID
ncbi:MAG: hypothetical protein JNK45_06225 [Myxococcales bacterium]|nr:hypothetical protein [Myxococcales bacterium]